MLKTETIGLTQYNFLINAMTSILIEQLSERFSQIGRDTVFQKFIMPGIRWAIRRRYPDLSSAKMAQRVRLFVADLKVSSEESEHMEIFIDVIDYIEVFVGFLVHYPNEKNYKNAEKLAVLASDFMKVREVASVLRRRIVDEAAYIWRVLERYGTKQEAECFRSFVMKHEETGVWDWGLLNSQNIWSGIMAAFRKYDMENEARQRLKSIKKIKAKQSINKKPANPIDKFFWTIKYAKYNLIKIFKESEFVSGIKNKIKKMCR